MYLFEQLNAVAFTKDHQRIFHIGKRQTIYQVFRYEDTVDH